MSTEHATTPESYLTRGLRAVVYLGMTLLLLEPLVGWPGLVAGTLAACAGMWLGGRLASSRLRLVALVPACLLVLAAGFKAELLGTFEWPARLLGVSTMLRVVEVAGAALTVLGAVVLLRLLALRFRWGAGLEAAAAVAVSVLTFLDHRDQRISRPYVLADWSFAHGHDPRSVLTVLGLLTAGGALLLLFPRTNWKRTATASACLALLFGLGWLLLQGGTIQREIARRNQEQKKKDDKPEDQQDSLGGGNGGGSGEDDQDEEENPPVTNVALVNLHTAHRPVEGGWYFRSGAQSVFNGTHLVKPGGDQLDPDLAAGHPVAELHLRTLVPPPAESHTVRTTVHEIEPQSAPLVLVNGTLVRPATVPSKEFVRSYEVESAGGIKPTDDKGRPVSLMFWLLGREAGDPSWSAAQWRRYTAGPSDPRYRQLADKILAEGIDPKKVAAPYHDKPLLKAQAIKSWIEDNTRYTKHHGLQHAADPTATYLFEMRRGKCVHIAAATVYLLRSLGIPARVATGYMLNERDAGRRTSLLIRSSDAHAWAEVYVRGYGWLVVDASPPSDDPPPPPPPDGALVRQLDKESRQQDPSDDPEDRPQEGHGFLADATWLVLALLLGCYGIKAWRQAAAAYGPDGSQYRLTYRAVLDRLAELGVMRQEGETREEFARRVAERIPEFAALTTAHLRAAVGGGDAGRRADWDGWRRAAVARLQAAAPRWRRLLGRLNPVSWWWAR